MTRELAFILGSPNSSDATLSTISVGRVAKAMAEQRKRPGIILLATGGFGAHFNASKVPHREIVYRHLEMHGARVDRALPTDLLSSNTVEDIVLISAFARARGIESYDIITSEFHEARCRFILSCIVKSDSVNVLSDEDPSDIKTEILEHEQNALARLKSQGGVLIGDTLHPPIGMLQ